jgi:uncharacterized membrane protein
MARIRGLPAGDTVALIATGGPEGPPLSNPLAVCRDEVCMSSIPPAASSVQVVADIVPAPRSVPFDAPWGWLAAGWRDMWSAPAVSLTYGAVFAAVAMLIGFGLWEIGAPSLYPTLTGGFLLIGPLVAVGLYDASRRLAAGEQPTLRQVASAGFAARGQLGFFGAGLLFVFMAWMQLAILLLMLFLGDTGLPPPSAFMQTLLFTPRGLGLLIVGTMVGGGIAALVFATTVMAVPLLLVSEVDAVTAARASIAAIARNPKPMALWAGLIVCLMAAGFVSLLIGLVVVFPLIGHATWHAFVAIYCDTSNRS